MLNSTDTVSADAVKGVRMSTRFVLLCCLYASVACAQNSPAAKLAPPSADGQRIYPINLATALQLAQARPIDVQIAARQVEIAAAQFDRAKYVWLPSIYLGGDYFHHDGNVQNFQGEVLRASRTSVMAGIGGNLTWNVSEGIFAPLAAQQELNARRAQQQALGNDITLQVAESYFQVLQARGELAGSNALVEEAQELVRRAEALAEGLAPPLEASRARVELARRKQAATKAKENWRTASAELARLLRVDAAAAIEPAEPAHMVVTLIDAKYSLDELIPIALLTRPELQAHQAFVKATLERLNQERLRPLVPSVVVRSVSTNPSGTLGYGTFGGGPGGKVGNYNSRLDYDVQVVWELQNLGFGNAARTAERRGEHATAILELLRTQDRIAADVAKAYAETNAAGERLKEAEPAFREALDSFAKNMEGLRQTRRVGNILTLVVRPQEAVAAMQALAQAYSDYFTAVHDFNKAQFRLYRALGHPSSCLADLVPQAKLGTPTK